MTGNTQSGEIREILPLSGCEAASYHQYFSSFTFPQHDEPRGLAATVTVQHSFQERQAARFLTLKAANVAAWEFWKMDNTLVHDEIEAFKAGRRAFHRGDQNNPFYPTSINWRNWEDGWAMASERHE